MNPQIKQQFQKLSKKYNEEIKAKDWEPALRTVEQMLQLVPGNPICFTYRGFVYYKSGELSRAELDFKHALSLNPKIPNAQKLLEKLAKDRQDVASQTEETETVDLHQKTPTLPKNEAPVTVEVVEDSTTTTIQESIVNMLPQELAPVKEDKKIPPVYLVAGIVGIVGILTLGIGIGIIFSQKKPAPVKEVTWTSNSQIPKISPKESKNKIKAYGIEIESDAKKFLPAKKEVEPVAKKEVEPTAKKEVEPVAKKEVEPTAKKEVETKKQSLDKTQSKKTVIGFMGIDISSAKGLVLLVDGSKSMNRLTTPKQTRWQKVTQKIQELLPKLEKSHHQVKINIGIFGSEIALWKEELEVIDKAIDTKMIDFVLKYTPKGGTNIYDSLYKALHLKDVDTIVLIADGAPGSGKYVTYSSIIETISKENQNVKIHTIAIDLKGSPAKFLQGLAKKNQGTFKSH